MVVNSLFVVSLDAMEILVLTSHAWCILVKPRVSPFVCASNRILLASFIPQHTAYCITVFCHVPIHSVFLSLPLHQQLNNAGGCITTSRDTNNYMT